MQADCWLIMIISTYNNHQPAGKHNPVNLRSLVNYELITRTC